MLRPRININGARHLIALATGKPNPVTRQTVYRWMNTGRFPKPLTELHSNTIWDTYLCVEKLNLDAATLPELNS